MLYTFRNIVSISFGKTLFFTINYQFNLTLQDYPDLCSMRMLRQISIFFKLHKYNLMSIRL